MNSTAQFQALYYSGQEKYSVRFRVSSHARIEVECENAKIPDITLQNKILKLIGDPETTLQISWEEDSVNHALLCNDPALISFLLTTHLTSDVKTQLLTLQKKQQQQLHREKKRVPLYLAVVFSFFVAGYFLINHSSPIITDLIPYEWEQKIGSYAFENYLLGKQKINNTNVASAIKAIVNRIDQFDDAEIAYEIAVIDADMVNAFAFPGGFIIVTTGLINSSDQPEQVAGVLAHELTHVIERHGMRKLVRQAGLGLLIGIVLGDSSALSHLIELSSQLDSLAFDRDQELQADNGAIKILQAAGISPQHFVTFFKKIKQLNSVAGDIPEILSTHPLTDKRIERVAAAQEPQYKFTFDFNWDRVKQKLH
jgi:Zn-dependent protease with chaperone function